MWAHGERQEEGAKRRHWPSRANLNAISFVALLAGAITAAGGTIKIASAFGVTLGMTLATSVDLSTPPLSGSVPPGPFLLGGQFQTAVISATGISLGARLLVAAAAIVGTLCTIFVALTISVLCQRLRRGAPFARSLASMLFAASLTLMIGGVIGQALTIAGASAVAVELNNVRGTHDFVAGGPADFTPVVAGMVLGVIAAAFRIGERMQQDTEGLV
jgi:hypothetical protein